MSFHEPPKRFQEVTASHIFDLFVTGKQNRVLLADEVGLGKTIIANDVIQKMNNWRKEQGFPSFKVIYICANLSIATQNCSKLGFTKEECEQAYERRLSMQHLYIFEQKDKTNNFKQSVPMTPGTSFYMSGGNGIKVERALIYVLLRQYKTLTNLEKRLSEFLSSKKGLQGWNGKDGAVERISGKVTIVNEQSKGTYLQEMTKRIDIAFNDDEKKYQQQGYSTPLYKEICEICSQPVFSVDKYRRNSAIKRLRRMFAEISLKLMQPDLVIMDEFQRFKELLDEQDSEHLTESGMLSSKFFSDENIKILLLSATPYKLYSTLEDLSNGSGNHYQEFFKVVNFLFNDKDKQKKFKDIWKDYSHHLYELKTEDYTLLIAAKKGQKLPCIKEFVVLKELVKVSIMVWKI